MVKIKRKFIKKKEKDLINLVKYCVSEKGRTVVF